jgi:hypothetical protein
LDLCIYSINNPLYLSNTSHIQPALNCSLCFQPIDFPHSLSTLDSLSSRFICSHTSHAWLPHIIPCLLVSSASTCRMTRLWANNRALQIRDRDGAPQLLTRFKSSAERVFVSIDRTTRLWLNNKAL